MHEPAKEEDLLYYCTLNIYIGKGEVLLRWLYTIGLRVCTSILYSHANLIIMKKTNSQCDN